MLGAFLGGGGHPSFMLSPAGSFPLNEEEKDYIALSPAHLLLTYRGFDVITWLIPQDFGLLTCRTLQVSLLSSSQLCLDFPEPFREMQGAAHATALRISALLSALPLAWQLLSSQAPALPMPTLPRQQPRAAHAPLAANTIPPRAHGAELGCDFLLPGIEKPKRRVQISSRGTRGQGKAKHTFTAENRDVLIGSRT